MAIVSIVYDDAVEAAVGEACIAQFGQNVVSQLVTNWLKDRAEKIVQADLEFVRATAKNNSTIRAAMNALIVQAKATPR